jgi:hypothetical protein
MRAKHNTASAQQGGFGVTPAGATGALLAEQLSSAAPYVAPIFYASRPGTTVGQLHIDHRMQHIGLHVYIKAAIRQIRLGYFLSGLIENVYDSHIVISVYAWLLEQSHTFDSHVCVSAAAIKI